MNTEHFKILLRDKESELESTLSALKGDERVAREVRDSVDDATASHGKAESFEEASVLSQMLEQVRDALHRLADGTYGKCILCGRQIELSRLEAVPWTAYCLEDQEKQGRESHQGGSML